MFHASIHIYSIFLIIFIKAGLVFSSSSCFDLQASSNTCHLCSCNYYYQPNIWNFSYFPPSNCLNQNTNETLTEIYVSSDISECDSVNLCDGSIENPYNDLFEAIELSMEAFQSYFNPDIIIYLIGNNSHSLYTLEDTTEIGFFIFRRYYVNLTIQPFLCKFKEISNCNSDDNAMSEILIKSSNIFFFIHDSLILRNIRLNGIDANLYTKLNDSNYKETNKQNALCSEDTLINQNNNDPIQINCFIQNQNVVFNSSALYGLFNLELFLDCTSCSTPSLTLENCDFIYMIFTNGSSANIVSLLNVVSGFPAQIIIQNTIFQKFLLYKGIININKIPDSNFYKFIQISNYFQSTPALFQVDISNTTMIYYNFFNNSVSSFANFDFLSFFNFNINDSTIIYNVSPIIMLNIDNCTFANFDNVYLESKFFLTRVSGFNILSEILIQNSSVSYLSYGCFLYIWNPNATIIINSSQFFNNTEIWMSFTKNPVLFDQNEIDSHINENFPFFYVNGTIMHVTNSRFQNSFALNNKTGSFINILETNAIISDTLIPYLTAARNVNLYSYGMYGLFGILNISNCTFENLTSISIMNSPTFPILWIWIFNTSFHNISSLQNSLFLCEVAFLNFSRVSFRLIFSIYIMSNNCLGTRYFSEIQFMHSNCSFYFATYVNDLLYFDRMIASNLFLVNNFVETSTAIYIASYSNTVIKDSSFLNITMLPSLYTFSLYEVLYFFVSNMTLYNGAIILASTLNAECYLIANVSNSNLYNASIEMDFIVLVNIENCNFSSNEQLLLTTVKSTRDAYVVVRNSVFENCQGLSISIMDFKRLLILNCKFFNNTNDLVLSTMDNSIDWNSSFNNMTQLFSNYYALLAFSPKILFNFTYVFTKDQILNFNESSNGTIFQYVAGIPFFNETQFFYDFLDSFGIKNCIFSGTLQEWIVLDSSPDNPLVMKNCIIKNIAQTTDNSLISTTSYIFFILSCVFQNISLFENIFDMTSCFLSFNDCSFLDISISQEEKSIFLIQNCTFYLVTSFITNILSVQSGYLNGLTSFINISNCTFNVAFTSFQGSFIYAETSEMFLYSNAFINGFSELTGGAIFVSQMSYFSLFDTTFLNNSAVSGTIYIEGDGLNDSIYNLSNLTFSRNTGDQGTIVYLSEANLEMSDIVIEENLAQSSLITSLLGIETFILNAQRLNFQGNVADILIDLYKITFSLTFSSFKDNNFSTAILNLLNVSLEAQNVSFLCPDIREENTIYIINSVFSYINAFFCSFQANYYSGCIYTSQTQLNLSLVGFISCFNAISLTSSQIFSFGTSFTSNSFPNGASVYASSSQGVMLENKFDKNFASDMASDLYLENTLFITLENCIFSNGNAYFLYSVGALQINLTDSLFINDNPTISSSYGLYLLNPNFVFLLNNTFSNLQHFSAVTILNQNSSSIVTLMIFNSSFDNCTSDSSGGAISLEGIMNVSILSSIFINNFAMEDGGSINFSCSLCDKQMVLIQNNIFENNAALSNGGVLQIFDIDTEIFLLTNFFSGNKAAIGNIGSTDPQKILVLSSLQNEDESKFLFLMNFTAVSGQFFRFIVALNDAFGNLLTSENQGEVTISSTNSSLKMLYNTENIFDGLANFSVSFIGIPNNSYPLTLTYSFQDNDLYEEINLYLLSCQRGEVLLNDECISCQIGFFSLSPDDASCALCPENAFCPGMDLIIPNEGYWRYHENSSLILKCLNLLKCPNMLNDYLIASNDSIVTYNFSKEFSYRCGIGSFGNLCTDCETGYGESSENNCVTCSVQPDVLILIVLNFFYLFYQSIVIFNVEENKIIKSSLMKLLINHYNYLGVMEGFRNVIFSNQIDFFLTFNKEFNTVGKITDSTVLDCIITKYVSQDNLVISRIRLFSIIPLIIIAILFFIRLSALMIPKLKNKFEEKSKLNILASCFMLVIYSFYPKLVNNTFTLLKCIELDDSGRTFLVVDPNIQCWEKTHNYYLLSVFLPNLLLWCLGWPLFLFLFPFLGMRAEIKKKTANKLNFLRKIDSKKTELNLQSIDVTQQSITKRFKDWKSSTMVLSKEEKENVFQDHKIFRFMTMDYTLGNYYWDSVIMLINLALNALLIESNAMDSATLAKILIGIFFVAMALTAKKLPSRYKEINNMSILSFIVINLMLSCITMIIIISQEDQTNPMVEISYVLLFLSNICFHLAWIYFFVGLSLREKITAWKTKKLKKNTVNKEDTEKEYLEDVKTNKAKNTIPSLGKILDGIKLEDLKEKNETVQINNLTEINMNKNTFFTEMAPLASHKDIGLNFQNESPKKIKENIGDLVSVNDI